MKTGLQTNDESNSHQSIRTILLQILFTQAGLILLYMFSVNIAIFVRKQFWKKTDDKDIIKKLLEILYLTNYHVWMLTINDDNGLRKKNITYSEIHDAYYRLDSVSRMMFWKYCIDVGLYDNLVSIINQAVV